MNDMHKIIFVSKLYLKWKYEFIKFITLLHYSHTLPQWISLLHASCYWLWIEHFSPVPSGRTSAFFSKIKWSGISSSRSFGCCGCSGDFLVSPPARQISCDNSRHLPTIFELLSYIVRSIFQCFLIFSLPCCLAIIWWDYLANHSHSALVALLFYNWKLSEYFCSLHRDSRWGWLSK